MLRMDSECATCETRQGSAQSAMTQAKKQAVNHSMEQAIKQSVRELACWCHNTVQDQHSKANSSCWVFTRSNRERMLGRPVTPRIRRKYIVWSITEVISRPGNLPRAALFRFRQGLLWRCPSGERRVWRHRKPCSPDFAQNNYTANGGDRNCTK